MRTMKFIKTGNRVQLLMKTNSGYFGIFFPVKQVEEYYEIVKVSLNAQDLINNAN